MHPGEEIITRAELAYELGLSERQIARMEKAGKGPARIDLGRRITYTRSAVTEWLKSREHPRDSTPATKAKGPSATGRKSK